MSGRQSSSFQYPLYPAPTLNETVLELALSQGSVPHIALLLLSVDIPVFFCPCFEDSLIFGSSAFHFHFFPINFLPFHCLSCEFISASCLVSFSGRDRVKHLIIIYYIQLKIPNNELLRFGLSI